MKDQYTGDINDYCKYALLRALSAAQPGRLAICWMRTAQDDRSDGGKIAYLGAPAVFRAFDAPLYDALRSLVVTDTRSVAAAQAAQILPNARFHSPLLYDDLSARERYFEAFWPTLGSDDLVFFDPDNGLEVPSVPKGRRNSSKYLYWDELMRALGGERAVCVYQHFPRRPRAVFVGAVLDRLARLAPDYEAFVVTSPWVAYVICTPADRATALRAAAANVVKQPASPLALRLWP